MKLRHDQLEEGKPYYYKGHDVVEWVYYHNSFGVCLNGKYIHKKVKIQSDSYKELKSATQEQVVYLQYCKFRNVYIKIEDYKGINNYEIY